MSIGGRASKVRGSGSVWHRDAAKSATTFTRFRNESEVGSVFSVGPNVAITLFMFNM